MPFLAIPPFGKTKIRTAKKSFKLARGGRAFTGASFFALQKNFWPLETAFTSPNFFCE